MRVAGKVTQECSKVREKGGNAPLRRDTSRPIQRYRLSIQIAFAALCLWIGVEFYLFVKYLETAGVAGAAYRPPGVEGFLPISSLMSLYYFFQTGIVHAAHPAGLFILLAILVVSFVFGKSFCSWLCPVGTLSEFLGDFGQRLFGRRLRLPRFLDYPLRSLKYLLLAFFVYAIFFAMSSAALGAFLDSSYNVVADVKMYYFFADISRFALVVVGVLFFLSIVIRNFWCRYLCPYGAFLGVVSLLSPLKIKRNPQSCIDCGKCARACPSLIKVDKVNTVLSDECTTCMNCVDVCPVKETLDLAPVGGRKRIPRKVVAIGVVVLFVAVTGLGVVTGNWANDISTDEYLHHQERLHLYGHPTGTREIDELNREVRKGRSEAGPSEASEVSPDQR